jgi:cytochrome b
LEHLQREKIWDPVTRLWHWVLALAVIVNWTFGTFMSFDTVEWHFYTGYLIIGLIVFRLLWGFIGPAPVRFKTFLPTPSSTLQYFKTIGKREPSGTPGHNPLGALSVIAMLLALAGQAFTGLFIEADDFFEYGPLNDYVSEKTVKFMSGWHHFLSDAILVLVLLHVTAILFYLVWKHENLIKPMINGWKWVRRRGQDQE